MKKLGVFALVLASLAAAAYNDVQVTYRGHLHENGLAPAAQTVKMVFRLYGDNKDTSPSWAATNNAVMVDSQGLFQVALRGEGLSEALQSGKANWIGVTIGNGKEQYPRQALLASARADRAETASRLADSPSIGTALVGGVSAESLSASNLMLIGGKVTLPESSSSVIAMEADMTAGWRTLVMKGKVRFFAGGEPRDLGTKTVSDGECSFGRADCNCMALFTSENSDIMPGMSLFVHANDLVRVKWNAGLPDGTIVRCRIYPIGVE